MALVDTNLLVALAVESHVFHEEAAKLLATGDSFAIAGHSLVETYNTLTRPSIYHWPTALAAAFVQQIAARHTVRVMTADQYLAGVARFASLGGTGARIYDFMIGEVAVVHRIGRIVTSNARDFRPLFPQLAILTPTEYLELR